MSFTLFSSKQTEWLNQERYIRAMNDGGEWVFFNEGREQPFEHPEKYKARRIVDRLTCEMLEEYCRSYGIRLFDEDFYGGKTLAALRASAAHHLVHFGVNRGAAWYRLRDNARGKTNSQSQNDACSRFHGRHAWLIGENHKILPATIRIPYLKSELRRCGSE